MQNTFKLAAGVCCCCNSNVNMVVKGLVGQSLMVISTLLCYYTKSIFIMYCEICCLNIK